MSEVTRIRHEAIHKECVDLFKEFSDFDEKYNRPEFTRAPPVSDKLHAFMRDVWCPLHSTITNCSVCVPKPPKVTGGSFFITFTRRTAEGCPNLIFRSQVLQQLHRTIITDGSYVFEHPESNYHCHALVNSRYDIGKSHFKSFIKNVGNIDIKRVQKDNGIQSYLEKEGEVHNFSNHIEK